MSRSSRLPGCPSWKSTIDKAEIARRGLSLSAVQDVIGIAIGGKEAGVVFEGDRHFGIVVRLPEAFAPDIDALGNLPVPLPPVGGCDAKHTAAPGGDVSLHRRSEPDQPRERQAPRRRDRECPGPGYRLGGGRSARADRRACHSAARLLAGMGRPV